MGKRFAQEREETDPCLCLKPQPDSSPGRPACATAPFLLGFLLQSPKMDSAEAQQRLSRAARTRGQTWGIFLSRRGLSPQWEAAEQALWAAMTI